MTLRSLALVTMLTPLSLAPLGACRTAGGPSAECEPPCEEAESLAANADPVAAASADVGAPPLHRVAVTTDAIEDLQEAIKTAIAKAGPSVVSVYSSKTVSMRRPQGPMFEDPRFDFFFGLPEQLPREFRQQGLGSGFIIDAEGYILTNSHVVEGADEIKVELADDREFDAKLVGIDPPTDLAVLEIEADGLQAVELGDSDALEVGDWVLAIGNPFGLPQTVSSGIVSAKGRANMGIVDYENFIQTDAAVNPGNSGGPLVDLQGRVVGINTAIASRSGGNDGIAFAIPIDMAKNVIDQLRGQGKVVRGHLGVLISELSPELAESFAFEGKRGLLVQDVTAGSAAEQAGLRPGDIVTQLDGQPVATVSAFRNAVARKQPGASVQLELWREGKAQTVSVKLGEVPGAADAAASGDTGDTTKGAPPKLGLGLQDITPQLRQRLGLEAGEGGVVITTVKPGSPAASAGLAPGDVLQAVDGTTVESTRQAQQLLRGADLAKGVRLRVSRRGTGRFVFLQTK